MTELPPLPANHARALRRIRNRRSTSTVRARFWAGAIIAQALAIYTVTR